MDPTNRKDLSNYLVGTASWASKRSGSLGTASPGPTQSGAGWLSFFSSIDFLQSSGTLTFNVAANPGTLGRVGVLLVAGQNFTVNQAGAGASSQIRVYRNGLWFTGANRDHAWNNTPTDQIFPSAFRATFR